MMNSVSLGGPRFLARPTFKKAGFRGADYIRLYSVFTGVYRAYTGVIYQLKRTM